MEVDKMYVRGLDNYIIIPERRHGFDIYVLYKNEEELCTFNNESSILIKLYRLLHDKDKVEDIHRTINYKDLK